MNVRKLAVPILLVALLAGVGGYELARWLQPAPKPPIPDFVLPDLDSNNHSLSEWRGRYVLLNFWATWCPPCRAEVPAFVETQNRHGARGVQIVGVATFDQPEAVRQFRAETGMNYPTLIGYDAVLPIMAMYGNPAGTLPFTVLLDPSGEIVERHLGSYTAAELDALIARHVPAAGPSPTKP